MTDLARPRWRLTRQARIRIGYLVAGGLVGTLWMAHAGDSPLRHALRLVVLMLVAMTLATAVRRVAARRGRHPSHPPLGKFLALKGAVVILAVSAGALLDGRITNVDMWIGLGLVAVVALAGPMIHPWLSAEAA